MASIAKPAPGGLTAVSKLMPDVNEVRVYEARIVIQLDAGEAIYSERLGRLYFCDGPGLPIADTVAAVLRGLGRRANTRPVLIDQKGFFAIARKVDVPAEALVATVAALRLVGADVKGASPEVLRRAEG